MTNELIEIYVNLLDEGTPTIRPTLAEKLSGFLCRLQATPDYDPEDETWEFLPGTVVKYQPAKTDTGEDILLAILNHTPR